MMDDAQAEAKAKELLDYIRDTGDSEHDIARRISEELNAAYKRGFTMGMAIGD